MSVLRNVEISRKVLETYTFVNRGAESVILRKPKQNKVLKLFSPDIDGEENQKDIMENKLNKLVKLHNRQLKYLTLPINTISCEGEFIGYEMNYCHDDEELLLAPLYTEEKIEILKRIKEILEYFYQWDIIYGDIKSDNILINRINGNITFCDIDNIQIQNNPMDLYPTELTSYHKKCGSFDERVHSYMHNLLTLSELGEQNAHYRDVVKFIKQDNYYDLVDEKGKIILKEMKSITPLYSGKYLIDTIK